MKHSRLGGSDRRFSHPDTHHHDGHTGRSRHHGGSFGRGRGPFDYGELRLFVLGMIAEQPRHGYELIKSIEEGFSGAYSPSPGVIYPVLSMLEEMGLIALQGAAGPRKRYAITEAGTAQIAAERVRLDALLERLGEAAKGRGGVPAPILRGMENLKLGLRLRLARGDLTPDKLDLIATALDDATRAIERS